MQPEMASETTNSPLLQIPVDLRLSIYELLFDESHIIFFGEKHKVQEQDPNRTSTVLRRVCKAISQEVEPIMLQRSSIVLFVTGSTESIGRMRTLNSRIRHLEVDKGVNCRGLWHPQAYVLAQVCPRLESLRLVLNANGAELLCWLYGWRTLRKGHQCDLIIEVRPSTYGQWTRPLQLYKTEWIKGLYGMYGEILAVPVDCPPPASKVVALQSSHPELEITRLVNLRFGGWHFMPEEGSLDIHGQSLMRWRWAKAEESQE